MKIKAKLTNKLTHTMGVSTNSNAILVWTTCLIFTFALLLVPVFANTKNKAVTSLHGDSIANAEKQIKYWKAAVDTVKTTDSYECVMDEIFRNSFEYNLTPTDLSAVALGPDQVQLMWTAPEVNDVAGYRILESGTLIATTTTVAYLHVDVTPETNYSYTIEAFNTAGDNSPPTAAEPVTTPSETAMTALATAALAMEPGDWIIFATENFDNGNIFITPENGNITEYSTEAIWDPVKRRVFIAGGARGNRNQYLMCNQLWVQWSETTNAWTLLPELPLYLRGHSYDHAALDSNTGDYYLRAREAIQHYDASTGNWAAMPDLPIAGSCCNALAFFPDMDSLVFTNGDPSGNTKIFRYMKSSSSWQQLAIGQNLPMGNFHDTSDYSSVHGVLFFGGGEGGGSTSSDLYGLSATGNVVQYANAPVAYGSNNTITVTEPTTGNFLLLPQSTPDKFYEHVFSNDSWVTHNFPEGISIANDSGSRLLTAAAPIPEFGVIMFIKTQRNSSVVYLYKHQP